MTRPLLAWLWLLAVATGSICLLSLLGVDETPETHAVVLSIPSPECSTEQLAKIEAAYIAEATEACAGKTYDACPELPGIRAKYQTKREEWKSCSK